MKVTEHIDKAKNPFISFEIIPLQRGGDIKQLLTFVENIVKYNPPFIDVTSHQSEVIYEETPTGIRKRVKRKRPGTIGISVAIKNRYNIDTVPHLLCNGFTKEETEDALIELNYLGIENVLVVKGDDKGYKKPVPEGRSSNVYAIDLVKQVKAMNQGKYLEDDLLDAAPTDFCIGVGGYPEKHFEAPNLATDVSYAKAKVDAGADYIVTQMFFNNKYYFEYVDRCRKAGIVVPIIPGLKIITAKRQLRSIPGNFYVEIPEELSAEVTAAKPDQVMDVGVEWAVRQCEELLGRGVPSLHFYIMQDSNPVDKLFSKLKI